jgi:hypothetical protein
MNMPTHVPNRPRAKAIPTDEVRRHDLSARRNSPKHPIEIIDWLALWALSIGFSAIFIAATVFFGDGDAIGATVVMTGAAGLIALVLLFTSAPAGRR